MKEITIIGGGLAGLTLGILLRRQSVPVTVREAGAYPRHRVCGEFISGRGQDILQKAGLPLPPMRSASTAMFFVAGRSSPARELARPAGCISRHALDAVLAAEFERLGGDLRTASRHPLETIPEGTVLAAGRRAQATEEGWKWFGLKVHARSARLRADLEMHATGDGYVGVCRLPGDVVNVCGLFKRRASQGRIAEWQEALRGGEGSSLRQSLAGAEFDESSFCAVAGLSLNPQPPISGQCRIGDALTMSPPVTGNGMSMAFESAAIAAGSMANYARGNLSWTDATARVAGELSQAFSVRLRWARWLHQLMFWHPASRVFASPLVRSPLIWNLFFAKTR
jgi:flavin-dependent dehydrogenase